MISTVTTRLMGGLGNQLFQYASARALALRRGAEVKLDISRFNSRTKRGYELRHYTIPATIATADDLSAAGMGRHRLRFAARIFARPQSSSVTYYREPHFHFDPQLGNQPLPLFMDGYWQSEQYFIDAADTLRRELIPSAALESENLEIARRIDAVEAVSVHVRRGDYVTDPKINAFHGVCSLDYYRAAVAHIQSRVSAAHLFVFSDDHAWTRDNLKSDLPTTYVSANPPDRGFRDMQLMSRCRHHIVANSSFSWWGAWLNPAAGKIVVAPARWFASTQHRLDDLVPKSWVQL